VSRMLTEAEVQAQLDEAYSRPVRQEGPLVVQASYDAGRRRVMVEMNNGCTFGFPIELVPGTGNATSQQLARIDVHDGEALVWEELDTDTDVRGVLLRAFDVKRWAAQYMGSITSPAKAEAARENGKKGGRPRKRSGAEG
jgi:hypothetical protein